MKKHIIIDGRMMFQEQAHGIARVTIELLKHLPEPRRLDVALITAKDKTSRFYLGDLERQVTLYPTTSNISRPYDTRDLNRLLKHLKAVVFFSPYHVLAPFRVTCPLVIGVHDCILESDRRLSGGWLRRSLYHANTVRGLRQSAAVVVPSETTKSLLPAYYRGIPPVTVCRNGVDRDAWTISEGDKAEARREFSLPEKYILSVGASRPHKNQLVLVRALTLMASDVSLVIVAHRDPRVVNDLQAAAQDLGVADRVRIIDEVQDSQLRGLYGGATVFAFPSTAEGFGLPPLEAMSAGLPVVASAIPAVAETCEQAACLVSPYAPEQWAAALGKVWVSESLRNELAARGKDLAGRLTWQKGASDLYELLLKTAAIK